MPAQHPSASFRPAPARIPACTAFLLPALSAVGLALLFAACDPASPSAPPQAVSALYECRGVPGYSPIDWDSLRRELQAHPVPCTSHEGDSIYRMGPGPGTQPAPTVPVAVRFVILDAQCRLLAEKEDTASLPAGVKNPLPRWDGRLPSGSPTETGEYYVNTVARWPDGRKDTTYQKIGLIRTGCGG